MLAFHLFCLLKSVFFHSVLKYSSFCFQFAQNWPAGMVPHLQGSINILAVQLPQVGWSVRVLCTQYQRTGFSCGQKGMATFRLQGCWTGEDRKENEDWSRRKSRGMLQKLVRKKLQLMVIWMLKKRKFLREFMNQSSVIWKWKGN